LERIVVTMSKYSFLTKNWNVVVQGISVWIAAMSSALNIWMTAPTRCGATS
jgi:cytidylate kinase